MIQIGNMKVLTKEEFYESAPIVSVLQRFEETARKELLRAEKEFFDRKEVKND